MALVIYGGGVTEFVGSIGGTTYQSNGSGFIARSKPIYRKRKTILQANHISTFVQWSQYYRNLSAPDKSDWQYFADNYTFEDYWGRTKNLTALQWFLVVNAQYFHFNGSLVDTPVGYTVGSQSNPFTIDYYPTYFEITTASTFGTASDNGVVFFSIPTPTQSPFKRKLMLRAIDYIVGSDAYYDLTTSWEFHTGLNYINDVYNTGLKVQVAVSLVNSGSYVPTPFVFAT